MKKAFFLLSLLALMALAAGPALAHFPWLSVPHHYAAAGKKVKILVGWGHQFPLDDFAKTSSVAGVTIYDPAGKKTEVAAINDFMFQTEALTAPGAYVAVSQRAPAFYTKLDKGFARKPKTGLKGVKKCYHSSSFLKAIIQVSEGGGGDVSRKVGHGLELVPLKNPAQLKVGDVLPIQVLFNGKPLSDHTMLLATYTGFPSAGAWAHASYAGQDGVAKLRILKPGAWLAYVNVTKPYPKPQECDVTSYGSALTFEIK